MARTFGATNRPALEKIIPQLSRLTLSELGFLKKQCDIFIDAKNDPDINFGEEDEE